MIGKAVVALLLASSAAAAPEPKGLRAGYYFDGTKPSPTNFPSPSNVTSSDSSLQGVDISVALSSSVAQCFTASSVSFVIPRGYRSTGAVDTAVCGSLKSASSAGVPVRDTYMFPCPTCGKGAAEQVGELAAHLRENCAAEFSGRIWLDIEGSQYWTGDYTANREWYQTLVDACTSSGYKCGVYSSKSQWTAIFGSSSYAYGSYLPMWYAHYDNVPSFDDYPNYTYGGWVIPTAKQFQGDITFCGMAADMNFAEEF